MALIELDLTAQPEPSPSSPPPAHRYRLAGLLLAGVLAFVAGGAVPALPVLWRYLGLVPAPGGPEAPFRLTGDRIYTIADSAPARLTTAWSASEPPRRLWSVPLPAGGRDEDEVSWGGVDVDQAGDVVLIADGSNTTVVDAVTGAIRWTSPTPVEPLPDGVTGIVQQHEFRPGTVYDQASGEPGTLYFSATGEPHTEPPVRTDVRGVDLATGRTVWTVSAAGSVNVAVAPGDDPAVLLLSSDRLQRIDGVTGEILRTEPLPRVRGAGPSGGELVDGQMAIAYGHDGVITEQVAYSAETLARRWSRAVPEMTYDPANCSGVFCAGDRRNLDVLDPRTGRVRWRAPADVDLTRYGAYVVQVGADSGMPVRLVDPVTGATRVDLSGWRAEVVGETGQPIVLRRGIEAGRSAFGVVLADRDRIQPLGVTAVPVSDCTSDRRRVVCRTEAGLRIWAYRA